MANIYFHFPFCKQACHYCNFHFSTTTHSQEAVLKAFKVELELRRSEFSGQLESIYFGGGSPSLMTPEAVGALLEYVDILFTPSKTPEITMEINPDDVSKSYLEGLKAVGVNRVSLGIQSFIETELQMMNRAHNVHQAKYSLELVASMFDNFSVDLIYGMPNSTLASWEQNITSVLDFSPPHVSTYALTVEPKTVLAHQVAKNKVTLLEEDLVNKENKID